MKSAIKLGACIGASAVKAGLDAEISYSRKRADSNHCQALRDTLVRFWARIGKRDAQ
jgi:hypothetical protein